MIEKLIVDALVDAVVDKAAEVIEDFASKNTKQSAAEDHRKGLDHVSPE